MKTVRLFGYATAFAISILFVAGCAKPTLTLMPTPVIYHNSQVDPFKHLAPEQKTTNTTVYYATTRIPVEGDETVQYGNQQGETIRLGKALIRMGTPETKWKDLEDASLGQDQAPPMPLTLMETTEIAVLPRVDINPDDNLNSEQQNFFAAINTDLEAAQDKEIMLYVHGAKVDFANSTILAAEIDHFAGRDFVGVAFSWPSHQNILYYLLGTDVKRALTSSSALKSMLILLSKHTNAEQINILAYSAGGKVTSKALAELHQQYPNLSADELQGTFRLGSVVFTAADVEVDIFLERLTPISELAQQVIVTVSDDDTALIAAKKFMGGNSRAGSAMAEQAEKSYIADKKLTNIEIIDVSLGKKDRGFDIIGHHYWYRHPWMSSDIIFLMRTDLPAFRRGLATTEKENVWYLPTDYPEKVRTAAETELKGQW